MMETRQLRPLILTQAERVGGLERDLAPHRGGLRQKRAASPDERLKLMRQERARRGVSRGGPVPEFSR